MYIWGARDLAHFEGSGSVLSSTKTNQPNKQNTSTFVWPVKYVFFWKPTSLESALQELQCLGKRRDFDRLDTKSSFREPLF